MPKMGESVNEGTIIKWHKKVGDSVKQDEIIFEISTDKVDTEIPSPADGILKEIKVKEGDTVEVGTVVAVIDSGNNLEAEEPKEDKQVRRNKLMHRILFREKKSEQSLHFKMILLKLQCRKWVNL